MGDERWKEIFDSVVRDLPALRRIPLATYRLQFNHQFKFSQGKAILGYLRELGISDIYASPYLLTKKGSLHGYDVVNPNLLNPEIGTEEEYGAMTEELAGQGMGQVQDIVPNHMCILGTDNVYWMDVLENGPGSLYADFFDIDWKPVKAELENKVLLPILGDQYGQALENQELRLHFEGGAFYITYFDQKFPLDPGSYSRVLKFRLEELEKKLGKDAPELQELLSITTALDHLPRQTEKDPEKLLERRREKEIIKKRIQTLYEGSEPVRTFVAENVKAFNGEKGNRRTFDLLDGLLDAQAYRFSYWRVATEEINFRRFFDINDLAAIRMERLPVFRETHHLIFRFIREGKVTGLRVDHPDGLYNPVEYFFRLQKGCFVQFCLRRIEKGMNGDEKATEEIERLYDQELWQNPTSSLRTPFYVIGEKILTKNERIPEDWPICGTVGYEYLNLLNGLFVDGENAKPLSAIYNRFTGTRMNVADLVYEKKKLIMQASLSGEVNTLAHRLNRLTEKDRHTRDFTLNSLRTAIIDVIACFPIYRTYVTSWGVIERDRRYVEQAVNRAKRKNPAMSASIFEYLKRVLLLEYPEDLSEADRLEWLDFVMKFQQVTGPVMAKGLEDTAFYVYNRLASLNEVGGNPEKFGTPLENFHGQNMEKIKFWPYGMNATSTHDTKRSEDVRARLNVLSEIPEEWKRAILRWARMNARKKRLVEGQWAPDRNEEYLFYQTLLGAWPLENRESPDEQFRKRIKDYMLKAIREAKVNSSWISPHVPYEEALMDFIEAVLSPSARNVFLKDLLRLEEKTAYFGMFNALSQTLLKIVSPGTPDFYQGTEVWDFSLVDPDNRRPVDFEKRKGMLRKLAEESESRRADLSGFAEDLLRDWKSGRIKLYVIFRALNFRRENSALFLEGNYLPLTMEGSRRENVCALARRKGNQAVLAVACRFLTRVVSGTETLPLGDVWQDSILLLPDEIPENTFTHTFTGEQLKTIEAGKGRALLLRDVFAHFPVALLACGGEETR